MQTQRNLLDACQQAIVCGGFDVAALRGFDLQAIGAAGIQLAQAALADTSGMLVHPLGFGRIPLTAWLLDEPRIAVHIWDSNARIPLFDDVHDHCYDFVSLCHVGALEHRMFRAEDVVGDGHRSQAMNYSAGSCDSAAQQREGREMAISETGRQTVEAPSLFALRHDVLHSARPLTDLTVTVQFQSPCIKAEAQVYRSNLGHQDEPAARVEMTRSWLADALARAV